MSTRSALTVVLVAGTALTGCAPLKSLFNISGPSGSKETSKAQPDAPVSETQAVALPQGFATPIDFGDLHSQGQRAVSDFGANCPGYVGEQPVAVLDLEVDAQSVLIEAPGAGSLLVRVLADDTHYCVAPHTTGEVARVRAKTLPAGKVELYVGSRNKGDSVDYSLSFDETSRPIELPWKATAKPLEVGPKMSAPVFTTLVIPPSNVAANSCNEKSLGYGRRDPDLVLSLSRPTNDLELWSRGPYADTVGLFGPIPDNGRNPDVTCDKTKGKTFEPGLYAVFLGRSPSQIETVHTIGLSSKSTSRNPMTPPEKFTSQVPLEARNVVWHFPELNSRDLTDTGTRTGDNRYDTDEVRAWVLEQAPKTNRRPSSSIPSSISTGPRRSSPPTRTRSGSRVPRNRCYPKKTSRC